MDAHQLINQNSLQTVYLTPPDIIARAVNVMGAIDLDPASETDINDLTVRASRFYSAPEPIDTGLIWGGVPVYQFDNWGGLSYEWEGRVFLNHPFGRSLKACKPGCEKRACYLRGYHSRSALPGNADWVNKLVSSYMSGDISEAICLTYASTSEAWLQPLLKFPNCFISPRLNYWGLDLKPLKGVTKGSMLTYLGHDLGAFRFWFHDLGVIK